MQVILTPTAVANMFGPGLHGFKGTTDTPPTQLSPEWCNSVQMELVNIVLSQGGTLDGLVFDQVATALNSWQWSGTPTLLDGAQLFVSDNATVEFESGSSLIMANGSEADFNGTTEFNGPVSTSATVTFTFNGAAVFKNTATFDNTATFNKPAAFNDTAEHKADVSITTGAKLTTGVVKLSPAVAPASERELVADSNGNLVYRPTDDPALNYVHHSTNGWTYATGEQEAETALQATNLALVTSVRCLPQSSEVLVIAEGWGQVNTGGGDNVVLQLQYDDGSGTYSDQGNPVTVFWNDNSDAAKWSFFRIARRLTPGVSVGRLYRLKCDPNAAATCKIRESTIRVVNPQR